MKSPSSLPSRSALSARLHVVGDYDPQLPGRVLDRFTQCNRLPTRTAVVADEPNACLRIDIEYHTDADAARQLARRLLSIPSVREVSLSLRYAPQAVQSQAA